MKLEFANLSLAKNLIIPVGVFLFAVFAIWYGSPSISGHSSGSKQSEAVKDPVLLESIGPYNIVSYQGLYFGLPKRLGAVNWLSGQVGTLPGVVTASTLKEVKKSISQLFKAMEK